MTLVISVVNAKSVLLGAFFFERICCDFILYDNKKYPMRASVGMATRCVCRMTAVRLIGIDAPEMGGRGRTTEPYAVQAKRRLNALVHNNNKVHLRSAKKAMIIWTVWPLYDRDGVNLKSSCL